jgi:hypothetical protein
MSGFDRVNKLRMRLEHILKSGVAAEKNPKIREKAQKQMQTITHLLSEMPDSIIQAAELVLLKEISRVLFEFEFLIKGPIEPSIEELNCAQLWQELDIELEARRKQRVSESVMTR